MRTGTQPADRLSKSRRELIVSPDGTRHISALLIACCDWLIACDWLAWAHVSSLRSASDVCKSSGRLSNAKSICCRSPKSFRLQLP
eukprot:229380-Prymnesium_polylepis.3